MSSFLKEAYDALKRLGDAYPINGSSFIELRNLCSRIEKELNPEPKPMEFDPTKPVQLRNGQPAVILEVLATGEYPIFGRYLNSRSEGWLPGNWNAYGSDKGFGNVGQFDLINIPEAPEKAEFWVNVYKVEETGNLVTGSLYKTKQDALKVSDKPFACIKISCAKGEGL